VLIRFALLHRAERKKIRWKESCGRIKKDKRMPWKRREVIGLGYGLGRGTREDRELTR
jgi:hypothetical protein